MRRIVVAPVVLALFCLAAAPATQPDALEYPALQRMLLKLETRNKELETQNAGLIHENVALKEQVVALTPVPKKRVGNTPDDGKPHPENIIAGISLDDALDLAGPGNLLAIKKTATATVYYVFVWDHDTGEAVKDRHIWGTISVAANGQVTGTMPR